MSELKTLHPYLYMRVRLKGVLFTLLGLSSIFGPWLDRLVHAERNTPQGLNPMFTGAIFIILGMGVLISLYATPKGYLTARKWLYGCAVYAIFWEFVLLGLMITQSISTISIFILWGYLTYNLIIISRDSAWEGAEIVREIKENGNGTA